MGPDLTGLVSLPEKTPGLSPSFPTHTIRKGHVRTEREVFICQPEGQLLLETKLAGTLILDFQPPEPENINFCC